MIAADDVPGTSIDPSAGLSGETLFGAFLALGSASAAEIVGRAGLDWVIVDLEHGAGTEADLLAALYAVAASGIAGLVRP
jgi:4-hydroxy-2-oxoheptanedioate aldolase